MNGPTAALAALEAQLGENKLEWRYEMRREAQEILPGLFVGPFQPSFKLEILQRLGITHVLCIAETREKSHFTARFPEQLHYLLLEIRDADDQNLIRIFPQSQAFIDGALAAGGRVLVHCGDGISRSPAVVTAYVMCKTNLTHEDAFTFVQSRRFCVAPRIEFQHQLEAYETIFRAGQTIALDRQAQTGARERRRGREDDEEDDSMMVEGSGGVDVDMSQRVPSWVNRGMPS